MLPHGRIEALRIPQHELVDLVAFHEPVRVVAVVGKARKRALPVRGDQGEVVPARVLPLVCNRVTFQHNVFDSALSEVPTDRQARLSAPITMTV